MAGPTGRTRAYGPVRSGRRHQGPRVPGVVLEVSAGRAIVLAEGRFCRLRAVPGWESGSEVWVALPQPQWGGARLRRWVVAVASAAVAVGAGTLSFGAIASAQVAAVVSLDINPSVQLAVDGQGRVVGATAMDAGGRRLLQAGGVRGDPVGVAISVLVQRAVQEGYLTAVAPTTVGPTTAAPTAPVSSATAVGAIWVTVAPAHAAEAALPPAVVAGVAAGRAQAVHLLAQRHVAVPVDVAQANAGAVRQARSSGLSLGRQVVYGQLREAGAKVSKRVFRRAPLDQAIAAAGVPSRDVAAVLGVLAKDGEDRAAELQVLRAAVAGEGPAGLQRLAAALAQARPTAHRRHGDGAKAVHGSVAPQGRPGGQGAGPRAPVSSGAAPAASAATAPPRTGSAQAPAAAGPTGGLARDLVGRIERWLRQAGHARSDGRQGQGHRPRRHVGRVRHDQKARHHHKTKKAHHAKKAHKDKNGTSAARRAKQQTDHAKGRAATQGPPATQGLPATQAQKGDGATNSLGSAVPVASAAARLPEQPKASGG